MPRPPTSSHPHRRRVIVAPESPPATPPLEAQVGHASSNPRTHPYHPLRPRAIVQRSYFSIKNPSPVESARSSRHSTRHHYPDTSPSHSARQSQPGSVGTPVFKLDEDLQNSFNLPPQAQRRLGGRTPGIRRSESMEALPIDNDVHNSRYSESEPPNPSTLAQMSSSRHQSHSPSSSRRSLDLPRPSGRRAHMVASAPIKIPSRAKQEEERQKRAAAAAKAKAVASNTSRSSRSVFRSRRPPHAEPKYGLHYSSSEDSLDELPAKRR